MRMRSAIVLALVGPLSGVALAAGASKTVPAGGRWEVAATTRLARLDVGAGAQLTAPAGHSLTLTVDGANVPVAAGSYQGDVVLTVTDEILVPYNGFGPYHYRAAVYVDGGKLVTSKSVAAAAGGSASDRTANDLVITSKEPLFNGVVVTGKSTYTINGAKIDLTGNGGNDFAGFGAAIMSAGDSRLTVNNANIRTHGAVRTALFIGGNSTMTVNDSTIEVFSGTLPADYQFSIMPGKMMEVPYGLGLHGNVRATNLIDTATVYYNNVHIIAHGWGALSSDGGGPTRMFVDHSHIETEGSGYGAYSNGDAHDHFAHTTLDVVDYGVVIGGNGSATLTDASVLNSKRIGVMMHQGTGGSVLTIDRKSKVNTRLGAIVIKGRGADVLIDDAEIHAGNGVIVQAMETDDPIMVSMMRGGGGAGGMPGGGGPLPGAGGPTGAGGPPPGAGGPPGGGLPGSEAGGYSPDINVTVRATKLAGDLVQAMSGKGDMHVALQNATLTGGISTATAAPRSGKEPTEATREEIGDVVNTFSPHAEKCQLSVFVDGQSHWVVDKTSYLNDLTLAAGAAVAAPEGATLALTVNGVTTPLKAGAYHGAIVLQVVRR